MYDFISVPRSIFRDESLNDEKFSRREAFLYLVQKAVFQEQTITVRGGRVTLKRGQVCVSMRTLALVFGWSKDKVSKTLSEFQSERRIDIDKDGVSTIVSIIDYDIFQRPQDTNQDADKDAETDKHNKDNNGNKDNKRKKTSSDVEERALVFPYSSDRFMELWNILVKQPKWKKKSQHALQLSLDDLKKYDEEFSIYLMEKSIKNNWQGVEYESTKEEYEKWKASRSRQPQPQSPQQQPSRPSFQDAINAAEHPTKEEITKFWNEQIVRVYQRNPGEDDASYQERLEKIYRTQYKPWIDERVFRTKQKYMD